MILTAATILTAAAVIGAYTGIYTAMATQPRRTAEADRAAAGLAALRQATTPIPPPPLRGVATGTGWADDTTGWWPQISNQPRPAALNGKAAA